MKIGFIGAGKVGITFGKYLTDGEIIVTGYFSKSPTSSLKAAELTKTKQYLSLEHLLLETEVIFITTPDDVIEEVCEKLAKINLLNSNHIICHMSGALSSEVLKSATASGCSTYSIHPLQSFADIDSSLEEITKTLFTLEGSKKNFAKITGLLDRLGNQYLEISTEKKILYHAAACVVSNYLVTLMDFGLAILEETGIPKKDGIKAIQPLVEGTLKNVFALGTSEALTGPIARGDCQTMASHLQEIKIKCPAHLDLYTCLGKRTLELAVQTKLDDPLKAMEIKKLLEG